MEEHEGGVTLSSEEGEGATFSLMFPCFKDDQILIRTEFLRKLPPGLGERILFLCMDTDDSDEYQDRLSRLGYDVSRQESVQAALDRMGQNILAHDVIVAMVEMHEMDGLEFAARIRDVGCPSKVILVSTTGSQPPIEDSTELGVSRFLSMPLDFEALAQAIRAVLDSK